MRKYKLGVICMVLGIVAALVGCTGQQGPWSSLTYHVTSMVYDEGCHFSLCREADGTMTLSGYCIADGVEYRKEEPVAVSQEAAKEIEALSLEEAVTAKKKPSGMVDGTQLTVTLGYADGSEKQISLSSQQREALLQLLRQELMAK